MFYQIQIIAIPPPPLTVIVSLQFAMPQGRRICGISPKYLRSYLNVFFFLCVCVRVYMCTYGCVRVYVYVYTCTCVYLHSGKMTAYQ